jgi:hypothetical protein
LSNGRRISLSKKQIEDGVGAELFSLCQSISADGRLSKDEIHALDQWLRDNKDGALPGIAFLSATLSRIIADGQVTSDEQRELLEAIEKVLPVETRKSAKAARKQAENERMAVREKKERQESLRKMEETRRRTPIAEFDFMVAGVHFEGRDRIIAQFLNEGDRVRIALDSGNPYDRSAVAINLLSGQQIGYVPRTESAEVTSCVKGSSLYIASVKKILVGGRVPIPVVVLQFFAENQGEYISEFRPDRCSGAQVSGPGAASRRAPQKPPPPEMVWYGEMHCEACGYTWQARRNTPPARCPSCSSRDVVSVKRPKRTGCLAILIFAFFFSAAVPITYYSVAPYFRLP